MSRFIQESNQQDSLAASILSGEKADADGTLLLPFALVDCDSLQTRQRQWSYHTPTPPDSEVGKRVKGAIERSVFPALSQIQWREPEERDRENVASCLRELIDRAKLNERVRAHVLRMYSAAQPLALCEVRP
jgi:hypothetical protein